ncbi:hypothetical protein T484DRAFT_1832209, partial [Baffinella frigidus]
ANPADLNGGAGGGDPRTKDKLLDGDNLTTSDFHMWLTTFTPGALHTITITLPAALPLLVMPRKVS